MKFTPVEGDRGYLDIDIVGPWKEAIMWEVPLMALVSEAYYQTVDRDWDYQGQIGVPPSFSAFLRIQTLEKNRRIIRASNCSLPVAL